MDLLFDAAADEFRTEVRAWLTKHVPRTPLPSMDTAEGFEAHREWEATMATDRMSVVSWPEEYGGRDAPLLHWVIFEEEYYRSGAPGRVSQNGIFLLAPTLFEHASKAQLDRIMPRMARADDIWGQAWSEPESGSDLASLRSTATRTTGGWLLNGKKTWSSRSSYADWAFGLFRSDKDAQRHKGITYFMFDLRSPGVTVRPIAQLDGEPGFAELFLEDVFVPDDPDNPAESGVIGEVNNGWRVAMSTAANERGLSLRAPGRFLAATDRLVELWKRNRSEVPAAADVDRRVAEPDRPLADTLWQLTTLIDGDSASSVPNGSYATLQLADGRLLVATGCNTGSATATVTGGTLVLGPLMLTRKACSDELMRLESSVVAVLDGTITFTIEADSLTLTRGDLGLGYLAVG